MQFNDSNSVYYFDLCDIPLPKKDRTEFYINLPNIIHNTLQQKHAAKCPAYMSYNCPQLSYICGMALMK